MEKLTTYLPPLFETYGFPEEGAASLLRAAAKFDSSPLFGLWEQETAAYLSLPEPRFFPVMAHLREWYKLVDEPLEVLDFLVLAGTTQILRQVYAVAGITGQEADELFDGAVTDLRCKLWECKKVYGVWGTFVGGWESGFFSLFLYGFGRLEYEPHTVHPAVSADGKTVWKGTERYVDVHIPSNGPLLPRDVDASLRRAARFFAHLFPGDEVIFTCESWLLFPPHKVILPPSSRIRQFAERFEIVSTYIDKERHDLWRVFYTPEKDDLSKFPVDTALQRIYRDWLAAGNPVGGATGFLTVKKSDI